MVKIIDCNLFEAGAEVICHQVNCRGNMGHGIAKQVRECYPQVYDAYKKLCDDTNYNHEMLLGNICCVPVSKGKDAVIICNMFGQNNYSGSGFSFTDYEALRMCLEKVREKYKDKRIALPYRMSSSVAGGRWSIVEDIILDVLGDMDVTICRLKTSEE